MAYGKELILDVMHCKEGVFTRQTIEGFLDELCTMLDVEREDLHWWDYEGYPDERDAAPAHMAGTSVVQFISKSSVVIHTIDKDRLLMLNVFTCGDLNQYRINTLVLRTFGGEIPRSIVVKRGEQWSA